jgi:hypothetical protein
MIELKAKLKAKNQIFEFFHSLTVWVLAKAGL